MKEYNHIFVPNEVFDSRLKPNIVNFLVQNYRWRNPKNNISSPGYDKLLKYCQVSTKRTIRRYENKAIEEGFIDKLGTATYEMKILPQKEGNFTILENIDISSSKYTIKELVLFFHLCRLAGDDGKCVISREKLRERVVMRRNIFYSAREKISFRSDIKLRQDEISTGEKQEQRKKETKLVRIIRNKNCNFDGKEKYITEYEVMNLAVNNYLIE